MLRRIIVATLAFALLSAAPATAHTDLVASDPRDGQTLSSAPTEIALTFAEDLLAGGDRLVAKTAAGTRIELTPQVQGNVLRAPWPTSAGAGDFTVLYRAVAADGHPLQGRLLFSVRPAASASPSTPSSAASPVTSETPDEAGNPWLIAGPALLLAVLAGAGFVVWRSRD